MLCSSLSSTRVLEGSEVCNDTWILKIETSKKESKKCKIKIWIKIILSFVLVITMMSVVDYIFYLNSTELLEKVNELELSKRVESKEANRIAYSIQRIKSNVREAFLEYHEDGERDEIARADSIVRKNILDLEISIQALSKATYSGYNLANAIGLKKSELQEYHRVDTLKSMIENFSGLVEKIFSLQAQLKLDEAETVFELEAEPVRRQTNSVHLI